MNRNLVIFILTMAFFWLRGCLSENENSKPQQPKSADETQGKRTIGSEINSEKIMQANTPDSLGGPEKEIIAGRQSQTLPESTNQELWLKAIQNVEHFDVFDESVFQNDDFTVPKSQGLGLTRYGAIHAATDLQRVATTSADKLAKGKEQIFSASDQLSLLSVSKKSDHFDTITSQILTSPATLFQEIKKIHPLHENGNGVWLIGKKSNSEKWSPEFVIRLWGKPEGKFEVVTPAP